VKGNKRININFRQTSRSLKALRQTIALAKPNRNLPYIAHNSNLEALFGKKRFKENLSRLKKFFTIKQKYGKS